MDVAQLSLLSTTQTLQVVLYLLVYWNFSAIFSHAFLVMWWVALTAQTLKFATVVAGFVEAVSLPGAAGMTALDGGMDGGMAPLLEMAVCAVYASSAMDHWRAALLSRLVLSVWVRRLSLWPAVWAHCGPGRRLGVCAAAALLGMCCGLQWAYYATLPLPAGAEAASPRAAFVWYLSVVNAAALLIRCSLVLVTAVMRSAGFPLLSAVARGTGLCHPRQLVDSAVDPDSHEHRLAMRYGAAIMMAAVAWMHAPEGMPVLFQVLVLVRLLSALGAAATLRRYRRVLLPFPAVHATPHDRCSICMEDYGEAETVRRLPCGHCFHAQCARRWLSGHADCPLCRRPARDAAPPEGTITFRGIIASTGRPASNARRRPAVGPRPRPAVASVAAAAVPPPPPSPLPEPPQQQQQQQTILSAGAFSGSVQPLAPRLPLRPPPSRTALPPPQSPSLLQLPPSQAPSLSPYRQRLESTAEVDRRAAASRERRLQLDPIFDDRPLLLPGATAGPVQQWGRRRERDEGADVEERAPRHRRPGTS